MDQIGIDIQKEVSQEHDTSYHSTNAITNACTYPEPLNSLLTIVQVPTIKEEVKEKQTLLQALPTGDEELYSRWKKLEAHREFLSLQEASLLGMRH